MSDARLVVRLPIYREDSGEATGEAVEIPLTLVKMMVPSIKVFDMHMRIVKDNHER